ncbi:hypothetical protein LXL04_005597 [Taraxacum kok-saghyz]
MEDSVPSIPPSLWASMNSWFTPTILFIFLNLMIGTILFTSNLPNSHTPEDQNEKPQKLARSPSILHRLRSLNLSPHRSQHDSSPTPAPAKHHHQQQKQQEEEDTLEIAATQYVFSHPENLDLNPTDYQYIEEVEKPDGDRFADLNHTNEIKLANAETHFFFESQHTVETVTTHFDFGPIGGETVNENEKPLDVGFVETIEEERDELKSLDEVYSSITGGGHVNRTKSDTMPASGELSEKLPAKMKKSASLKSAFSHFEEEKIVEARRPATVRERRTAAKAANAEDVEVDARADDFINKFKHQLKLQRLDSIIRYKDMVNRGSAN